MKENRLRSHHIVPGQDRQSGSHLSGSMTPPKPSCTHSPPLEGVGGRLAIAGASHKCLPYQRASIRYSGETLLLVNPLCR